MGHIGSFLKWYVSTGLVLWMLGWPGLLRYSSPANYHAGKAVPTPTQVPGWVSTGERALLARPVSYEEIGAASPDRFYPYGSTEQGKYAVHHGVEFVRPAGTPVLAVADGTVVVAGSDQQETWGPRPDYYGQLVVLQVGQPYHGASVYVLYGHLQAVGVRLGQRVHRGQQIGLVGSSGAALGPHLHLEVRVGRNAFSHTRNPELWFEPLPGHGTIVGRVELDGQLVPGTLVTVRPAERPNRFWRDAWTYVDASLEQLQSDDVWGENWALGDVPAGDYVVQTRVRGHLYTRKVRAEESQVSFVAIAVRTAGLDHSGPRLTRLGDGSE
jgi:murein DD-endopeptidase MepM/ murein hydrolase activator NlpD